MPVEVKSDRNLRSQSLIKYVSEYGPERSVKISMNPNFTDDGEKVRIPLWLAWRIVDIVGDDTAEFNRRLGKKPA